MRRVLVASDDAHTRAWVARSLDALDVQLGQVPLVGLASALAAGETDLAVVDGTPRRSRCCRSSSTRRRRAAT